MTENWNLKEQPTSWSCISSRAGLSLEPLWLFSQGPASSLHLEETLRPRQGSTSLRHSHHQPFAKGREKSLSVSLDYHNFQITGSSGCNHLRYKCYHLQRPLFHVLNYLSNFRIIALFLPWTPLKYRYCKNSFPEAPRQILHTEI